MALNKKKKAKFNSQTFSLQEEIFTLKILNKMNSQIKITTLILVIHKLIQCIWIHSLLIGTKKLRIIKSIDLL